MSIHSSSFFIWFIKYFGLRDTSYSMIPWNSNRHLKRGTFISTVIFPFKVYLTLTVWIVLCTTWMFLVHVEERWNIFKTHVHLLCNNVSLYPKNAHFLQYCCNFRRPFCSYAMLEKSSYTCIIKQIFVKHIILNVSLSWSCLKYYFKHIFANACWMQFPNGTILWWGWT